MSNIVAVITLLLSCYFLLQILKPAGTIEYILALFCLSTAQIIVWGYILSAINHLSDVRYWSLLGLATAFASFLIAWWKKSQPLSLPKFYPHFTASIKNWYLKELSIYERLILTPLILTVILLGVANLMVIVFTAPHNWDSMTYHLPRVAYYLQHNNINYFDANYWAQVIHPKNSSLLLLYTYLIAGRRENLTQLIQFVSYWVAVCSIYGISRKVGNNRSQSLFAAAVAALLTEWLMQATTTQNDMILTAYVGIAVYFLFAYLETHENKHLGLAALGIGLSIGTKASVFLPLLSVVLVAAYVLFRSQTSWESRLHNSLVLAGFTLLSTCIFALPAGYVENYFNFGNLLGPDNVVQIHAFEGESVSYIAQNGTKNLLRYGFEFLSLDGLPPIQQINQTQSLIRELPKRLVSRLGVELETTEATRDGFNLGKVPVAYEDSSYWGVFGFALIWIMVFLSLIGVIKSADIRILSLAAVLFLFLQAYSGPYDSWRGRYFTICTIFAVPSIGTVLQAKNRFIHAYILLIVCAGCISAISGVAFRKGNAIITMNYEDVHSKSIFTMDRLQQLTTNQTEYYKPLRSFEHLVPANATVAVFLNEDSFEYPLFGEYLSKVILPINSFNKGPQPIPASADYLLYTEYGFPCSSPNDIHLGADWYLRRLTETNRTCP